MRWVAIKRTYHGADEVHRPWIVMQEGATRGICECWTAEDAERIAWLINAGIAFVSSAAFDGICDEECDLESAVQLFQPWLIFQPLEMMATKNTKRHKNESEI